MVRQTQRRRKEQTELDEPIKIRFEGRLRDRINERGWDSVQTWEGDGSPTDDDADGEWVVDEDAEEYLKSVYRPVFRQKTNVVFETVEEATSFHSSMTHYSMGGVTWMNGMMRKSIRRVLTELREQMRERGHPPAYENGKFGQHFSHFSIEDEN